MGGQSIAKREIEAEIEEERRRSQRDTTEPPKKQEVTNDEPRGKI